MILRNSNMHSELMEYHPDMGVANQYNTDNNLKAKTNGFFSKVNNHLFGIGVSNGDIWVIVNGKAYKASETIISCEIKNREKVFIAQHNKKSICNIIYRPKKPETQFCYTEEDEDVDILLFISNILSSKERKLIFVENN